MAAGVLDQTPCIGRQMKAMDVFVARAQQSSACNLQQPLAVVALRQNVAQVYDDGYAHLAREREHLRIGACAQSERQQLVLRAEIGSLHACAILWISYSGSYAPR